MKFAPRALAVFALIVAASSVCPAQIPAVGAKAPKFTANNHDGKEVTFPPARRWAVLAFYPKASTPG